MSKCNQLTHTFFMLTLVPNFLSQFKGDWDDYENFYAAIPCGKMLAVMHKE